MREQIASLDAPFKLIRQHLPAAIENIEAAAIAMSTASASMSAAGAALGERAATESNKAEKLAVRIEQMIRSSEMLDQRIQESSRNLQGVGQLYERLLSGLDSAESHTKERMDRHVERLTEVFDNLISDSQQNFPESKRVGF